MKKYILLALGLFSFAAIGQEKLDITDLDEINNSIALKSQEEDYDGVLEVLEKINKNDTTYASSLIRKSYYLMALERYEDANATIDEGLAMKVGDLKSSFYQNKTVLFIKQEKFEKAITAADEGLAVFPANHILLYNKAVALQGRGLLKEAVKALEQVIAMSPFYAKAYIQLGSIYYAQERPTQALMAYNLALMVEPDGESSFERLKAINTMFSSENENKRTPDLVLSEDDKAFDDIDLIISNRIALNKNYKIDNDLDFELTKQNHALLVKLEDYKGKGGFWSEKVVPFFQWIQDSKNFDAFSYTISYSIENEKFKKIVEKKTKEVKEFIRVAIPAWTTITRTDNKALSSDKTVQYVYDGSSLSLSAMGTMEGDEKQTGDWFYFNEQGRMVTEAHYDGNGERTGNWKWYNDHLELRESAIYKDGELEGKNTIFYPNGQLSIKAFYKDGELNGEYLYYNEKGALKQKKYYEAGKLTGTFTSYFSVGEEIPEFIIPYKEDEVQEKASEYYANGKLYSEIPFQDGNRHGKEKTFHLNGNVLNEFTYVDGKLQGSYKSYHKNGKISEVGTYEEDLLQGSYTSYYPDETLKSEARYVDNSLDGSFTFYDYDGKKYYNYTYKRGDIIDYRFFNKKGEVLKEGKKRGGEFYYNGFAANGNLTSEGLYDVSGGRKGEWKYYGQNGNLMAKGTFEDDLTKGIYTSYFPNGTTEWIGNYRNDTLTGYYANNHKNGNIENQGGYKNGLQQGEWRFYYTDGSLKSVNFFHKGDFQGEQEYYGIDGKLTNTALYDHDNLISETFYDRDGKQFQIINYKPSKEDTLLIFKHYNGKTLTETSFIHGIKHGAYNSYFFDGKIENEGKYLNGSQNGAWTWYFENGKPKIVANYVLGSRDGEFVRYYENGQIEDSNFFELGDPVGTWKSYYEDGTLYTKTTYLNGEEHGRKEFYSPTGKLQLIRFYDYGTLIGYSYSDKDGKELAMIPIANETVKITAYYDNGKVSRELEFKNGQYAGAYKTYFYNGQLKEEFEHENGEYQGPTISYYANGNIKERQDYIIGELHGKETKYYEDGTLKEEAFYKNGIQTGNATSYDKTGKKTKSEDYFNGKIYAQQTF
ncbi:tetratricopeptide repeat protein [Aequorivita lipolytica]|uniref:Tetratricopeptide repeat protein n=1 Tax=Aequorivita lipolytica TaxID=153267 RepID=A0A5C6YPH3_9FLAO|nr:tetratricopeptide repeat protein [Aequorivita lipolytica]TXD69241.1 tetratricopeptide repeat protein [Aequorivita lipolytica]SRX50141.1 Beta-barrel assembly-enhancing protease [Aequorivita lipolytica]